MPYFLITCSSDGDVRVEQYEKEEIVDYLNDKNDDEPRRRFMDTIVEEDPQLWQSNESLIIKGEIVVPEAVTVVEKYKL